MSRYKSKYTGLEIDAHLDRARNVSNPNLLDNWYFGNPVNQRGQTSYSADWAYTIDRWQVSQNTTLTVNNGSVSSTGGYWFEPLEEIVDALRGRTVTISLLFASGELEFATGVVPTTWGSWDNIALSGHVGLQGIGEDSKRLWFMVNGNAENILAAKLELGDRQTLAHQDANGNWVLNEIPDYGEQLARCQRYYINSATFGVGEAAAQRSQIWPIKSTSIHYCSGAQFPVVMRTTPAVTIYSAVNGTKNAVSNVLNGTDSPATASATFVGSDGFHQVNLQGDDAALDQSVACFTYVASADL